MTTVTVLRDSTALVPVPAALAVAPLKLSAEQLAILNFVDGGEGNILVAARAGTGKSFIIRKAIPLMRPATGYGRATVAICAFNTKIAKFMAIKVVEDGNDNSDAGTFHSFGCRALRCAFPKAMLEGRGAKRAGYKKFDRIADELQIPPYLHGFVKKAMSLAMQRGFGILFPLNDRDQWFDLVAHYDLENEIGEDNVACQLKGREVLTKMGLQFAAKAIKRGIEIVHEVYSFDDMLYIPLVLNLPLRQYDWVCVDEAQDSNALRRLMAVRMTKEGGRRMWVGDKFQSINGFAGADNDSLDIILEKDRCKVLSLTRTYRCGKQIVAKVKSIVKDYEAADSNPDGEVLTIDEATFATLNLTPDDAIICRNTKPLVKVAYSLLKRGMACHIEGKDIAGKLLDLVNRYKVKTVPALKDKLVAYRDREVTKLMDAKKEMEAEALADQIETVFAIIEGLDKGADVEALRQRINGMFEDTDGNKAETVTLMTAHKSKGLEFRRVFGFGNNRYFPSKYAKQDWQVEQELNLLVVLWTRAIETYVDVNVD